MRSLNHIEQAFTYSNEVNPLCVAIVLRMRRAPTAVKLREALDQLQRRHILLRCIIVRDRGKYAFQEMETVAPIPLRRVHRRGPSHWEEATEEELNTRFDASGSLIRTVHLRDDSDESELILVLHHAVMDGISARLILHELLHLSTDQPLPPPLPESDQVADHVFPPAYRGGRVALKLIPFMFRQMWGELAFSRRGIDAPAASSPHNRILHLSLPADVSRRINLRIGRESLTLNSVVTAALLGVVRRKLHPQTEGDEGSLVASLLGMTGGKSRMTGGEPRMTGEERRSTGGKSRMTGGKSRMTGEERRSTGGKRRMTGKQRRTTMRTISFTDLRPSLHPVPDESVLGCMISMLRVAVPVELEDDLLDTAHRLRREIFTSGKSGVPFLFAIVAGRLTRLALRIRRGRIANAALSFLGKLNLEPRYGSTELDDVHAFITNNVVGPELSGFGKVLFGRIELDLTYLASEISESTARELLSEIEVSLSSLAG